MDIKDSLCIDKVYVLSVKSFSDRITHIKNELTKHNLEFEFIFDYDIDEINLPDFSKKNVLIEDNLQNAHKSLLLKHIKAWENCVQNNYKNILILEDDVLLDKNFSNTLKKIIHRSSYLTPGYLIFLSGRDTRVPKEFLLSNDLLFRHPIATADGYITDFHACIKRLAWLSNNKVNLPADHLIKKIDENLEISQYWSTKTLVEQGSVFGLFPSTLDRNRQKHTLLYNFLRYYMKIFTRRFLKKIALKVTFKKI